jgi:hypothetical protein
MPETTDSVCNLFQLSVIRAFAEKVAHRVHLLPVTEMTAFLTGKPGFLQNFRSADRVIFSKRKESSIMITDDFKDIFTPDVLKKLFPEDRTDQFFDALLGDASEGAYHISIEYKGFSQNKLAFQFNLSQRPGKCLACHLTYGLPQVFSRHPVINIKDLVEKIDRLLNGQAHCTDWQIGATREISRELHVIPLFISLNPAD